MAKRITKRDEILAEARHRVQKAENTVSEFYQKLQVAQAVLTVEREYLDTLTERLAPKPRQQPAATRPASRRNGSSRRQRAGRCVKEGCGEKTDSGIHRDDGGYVAWHPFQPPAPTARNQSPPNGAGASVDADVEVAATTVGAGGGEG